MTTNDLASAREAAAESAFLEYEFDCTVESVNSWHKTDVNEVACTLFVDSPCGAATERCRFIVRFKPGTAVVDEAFARDAAGNDFGFMPRRAVAA